MFLADDMAQPNLFTRIDQSNKFDDDSGVYTAEFHRDQLKSRYPHYFKKDVLEISAIDIVRLSCYFNLL